MKIVNDNDLSSLIPIVCEKIMTYLEVLSTLFDRYFDVGKVETPEEWIMNSHSFTLDKISSDGELKDLIELSSNRAFKRYLRVKLWKNISAQLWLGLRDFVKLY